MTPAEARIAVEGVLTDCGNVIVACSGGIDSLLLATIAHELSPSTTRIAHTVTPAVPGRDTGRVVAHASAAGWDLDMVRSNEFDDERYLSNPTDRCYFCKSHLYAALDQLASIDLGAGTTVVSGANLDDLGEYRPGLIAADEHDVRHPYIEAGVDKSTIRSIAREAGLAEADLPASPCLASRLYTGTRVTEARLRSVEAGEAVLRSAGFDVSRCRRRGDDVVIELPTGDHDRVNPNLLDDVEIAMRAIDGEIGVVTLDDRPYRPGQAVLHIN